MKTSRLIIALSTLSLIFASCSRQPPPSDSTGKAVVLQQEWFPFAGFAGEVSASKRFAAKNGINLEIRAGSEQVDPIKLVLSGAVQFGVVGGDLLVAAVAKGAPLVAIGVVNENTPTVFLVDDKSDIRGPKDFPGKKVGVLPGTNTERVYQLMMKRTGVERNTVTEVQIPFDLQTFLLKQYDVRPAFIYDETVSLEQKGLKYRVIKPNEFGVVFTGTVYFTTRETLQKDRAAVVQLLQTLIEGWQFALAEPEASIADLVATFPSLDKAREKRALELGKPYFSGSNGFPLQCATEVWKKMLRGLEEVDAIPANGVTVDQVWDPSPLTEAYALTKK